MKPFGGTMRSNLSFMVLFLFIIVWAVAILFMLEDEDIYNLIAGIYYSFLAIPVMEMVKEEGNSTRQMPVSNPVINNDG